MLDDSMSCPLAPHPVPGDSIPFVAAVRHAPSHLASDGAGMSHRGAIASWATTAGYDKFLNIIEYPERCPVLTLERRIWVYTLPCTRTNHTRLRPNLALDTVRRLPT